MKPDIVYASLTVKKQHSDNEKNQVWDALL